MAFTNHLRKARSAQGLSLVVAAELLGIHWRTLSRIERGVQVCHLAVVHQACKVFKCGVEDLFPGAGALLKKLEGVQVKAQRDGLRSKLAGIGVDPDHQLWFFNYQLENGYSGYFPVSGPEKKRLFAGVQRMNTTDEMFVVFDSEGSRVLLNVDALAYCQFLFEPPQIHEEMHDEEEADDRVVVHLRSSAKPVEFQPELEPEEDIDEENPGDFRHIFFMAENLAAGEIYTFHFEDVDGEDVFIQSKHLAMMIVPLWVFHPDLIEDEAEVSEREEER